MEGFWQWLSSIPWYAWVAIVAILGGCATSVTSMIIKHREKMEQIRFGDPSIGSRVENRS